MTNSDTETPSDPARDGQSPDPRASAAPVPPPLPSGWSSPDALAISSAYPPDDELWASHSARAKPPRRVGRGIAIVGLVAAAIGTAAVFSGTRLRGAAGEAATRVQTALAAASAEGNRLSAGTLARPSDDARAPDAPPASESKVVASEEPADIQAAAPVVLPPREAPQPTAPPRQPRAAEPESPPAPPDTAPAKARPQAHAPFAFARSAVTVSESKDAVALTIRRSGDAAGTASVVWWCREGTAIANKDFADLGQRTETFAPGETSRTIFVPVIKDDKAEVNKHFFVHLGEYDAGHRHLQVLSTVRVEIDDDD